MFHFSLSSLGFNLMLYGFGSKKRLIEEFRKKMCSNYNCVVINGFFPSVTLKNVSSIHVINVSVHMNSSYLLYVSRLWFHLSMSHVYSWFVYPMPVGTIGIILYCIGNSQWCIYNTQSKSDWLFNTQSRVLQGDWVMLGKMRRQLWTLKCPITISCNSAHAYA